MLSYDYDLSQREKKKWRGKKRGNSPGALGFTKEKNSIKLIFFSK